MCTIVLLCNKFMQKNGFKGYCVPLQHSRVGLQNTNVWNNMFLSFSRRALLVVCFLLIGYKQSFHTLTHRGRAEKGGSMCEMASRILTPGSLHTNRNCSARESKQI